MNRCWLRHDGSFQLVSLPSWCVAGHVSSEFAFGLSCQGCASVGGLVGERQEGLCRSLLLGRVVLVFGPFFGVFV